MRILVLGGTTEASALACLLAEDARFDATLSLAGRTAVPRAQPIPMRLGGFGGLAGLGRWLAEQRVEAVIDATHPYAAQISAHAVEACRQGGVPLVSIVRPPWQAGPGDAWRAVASVEEAAGALGATPCRVFLGVGRQELHRFAAAPQHRYVARVIDPPQGEALPPDLRLVTARGPFERTAERALLKTECIDVVVSKNSGGVATFAKLEAARDLGLPVIMVARPEKPAGHRVTTPGEALRWLAEGRSTSLRGV